MKLKTEEKTIHRVDSPDFDTFVSSIYGGDFNFVSNEESANDSSHEYHIYKDTDDDIYGEELIRKGDYPIYSTRDVFLCLLKDGHIEEGDYIINVCW